MNFSPTKSRRGTSVSEVIVAASLLIAGLGLAARGTVVFHRTWEQTRQYELAVDELANQLDRLTLLDESDLDAALAALEPPADLRRILPDAKFSFELDREQDVGRLTLSLQWERLGEPEPVVLTGWLNPLRKNTGSPDGEIQ